jgi:hypothetical protein
VELRAHLALHLEPVGGTRPVISAESKYLGAIVGVVAAALLLSALVHLQLFQDGASYLFELMISGSAVRHERLGVYIIQAPSIIALKALSFIGADAYTRLATERLLFSLNYAAVPLVAILLSWLVVRGRQEGLFLWAALIILFVNLVNFSWVSELLIAMQLACPLMLGCFIHPQRAWARALAVALGALIFFLHPLSFLLLLAIGIGSFISGQGRADARRAAFIAGSLLLTAAALKALLSLWHATDYERSMTQPASMHEYLFITPIENILFLALALALGLNRLLFREGESRQGLSLGIEAGLAAAGCVTLVSYYFIGHWNFPLKTGLALFAAMVLIVFASIDSRRVASPLERRHRLKLALALSFCFAAVIAAKSWVWHRPIEALERTLAAADAMCLERSRSDLDWLDDRPDNIIGNWSLPSLVLVMQMGSPAKYLLEAGDCAALRRSGEVRVDPWTTLSLKLVAPFTARESSNP